jgi:hypothetical protein
MMTQFDLEDFLGSLQQHLIIYIQHYMLSLYAILLMLLKWEFVEENWKKRSKLEYH